MIVPLLSTARASPVPPLSEGSVTSAASSPPASEGVEVAKLAAVSYETSTSRPESHPTSNVMDAGSMRRSGEHVVIYTSSDCGIGAGPDLIGPSSLNA
jgi:hypothetical protein